ncbi:proton-conducting transporter membrane subunit [Blastococcus brunescens]|uniref:Proton-conducting transporter membrane subunit n=1 Tax=Blastococcus brunescens TaxID=1564165 RepID=A0ABZ1B4H0_9ACTN|nr:proton-conducting transporter membrane subunit [Blastococcus sp. BMG 8361]WRL65694.1 proton-conducting transporter membrane subunit [Blastococcus sp. BMG 8361]
MPLLVAVIAAVSMTLGNLAAFNQTDVLRLLAYSTVSQVGYLFMVVAVAARTDLAVPALTIYLAGYAVTNIGAFAAAAAAPATRTTTDWATAVGHHRWLVVGLVVCLLGLVGTPPTAVFIGKLAVFAAAWDGGLAWLVVVAAINTVASLYYYLRWIAPAFAGGAAAPFAGRAHRGRSEHRGRHGAEGPARPGVDPPRGCRGFAPPGRGRRCLVRRRIRCGLSRDAGSPQGRSRRSLTRSDRHQPQVIVVTGHEREEKLP